MGEGGTLMARLWDLKPAGPFTGLGRWRQPRLRRLRALPLFLPTISAEDDVTTTVVDNPNAYHLIKTSVKSKNYRSRREIKIDLDGWHRNDVSPVLLRTAQLGPPARIQIVFTILRQNEFRSTKFVSEQLKAKGCCRFCSQQLFPSITIGVACVRWRRFRPPYAFHFNDDRSLLG